MRPKIKESKGGLFGTEAGSSASLLRWLIPATLVAVGVLCAAAWLLWPTPSPPPPRQASTLPPPPPDLAPKPAAPGEGPRVAIVVDDLGGSLRAAHALLAIPHPLTFAILPHLPHSREIAEEAAAAGREVLLHLPMEPLDYPAKDPGPGALLRSMSPEATARVLNENLDALPHAAGVNNHMGSRLTEDEEVMRLILTILKERQLFFLDSYTTPRSVVPSVARQLGLPTASRHVFLDHEPGDADHVAAQLERLIATAREHGAAIGICHTHATTISALKEHLPKLAEEGITVVPLSTLIASR